MSIYEAAKKYHELGYLPIPQIGKRPLKRHANGQWETGVKKIIKDENFIHNKEAVSWNDYNLGLLLKDHVVIDLDSKEQIASMEQTYPEAFQTAFKQKTKKGLHLFFRRPKEFDEWGVFDKTDIVPKVDLKTLCSTGTRGMIQVYPSPDKEWIDGEFLPAADDLPEMPETVQKWCKNNASKKKKKTRKVKMNEPVINSGVDSSIGESNRYFRSYNAESIKFIINHIWTHKTNHESFSRMGLALKTSFGERAMECLWATVSNDQKYGNYDYFMDQWNRFKSGELDYGWCLREAVRLDRSYVVDHYPNLDALFMEAMFTVPQAEITKIKNDKTLDEGEKESQIKEVMDEDYTYRARYFSRFFGQITGISKYYQRTSNGLLFKTLTQMAGNYQCYPRFDKSTNMVENYRKDPAMNVSDRVDFLPPPLKPKPYESVLNLYDGLEIEKYDVEPSKDYGAIIEHLDTLCNDNKEHSLWLLKIIAYKIRYPGKKIPLCICFVGNQGTGKTTFFQKLFQQLMGFKYVTKASDMDNIFGKFNSSVSQKLVILLDEVTRKGFTEFNSCIKDQVANETVHINEKGVPAREETNCGLYLLFSNEHDPLSIEVSDRRYVVIKTSDKYAPMFAKEKSAEYFNTLYGRVLNDTSIIKGFYNYLLTVDLSDFDPTNTSQRPVTEIYRDMQQDSVSNDTRFVIWLLYYLKKEQPEDCRISSDDVYAKYIEWRAEASMDGHKFSKIGLAKKIGKMIAMSHLSASHVTIKKDKKRKRGFEFNCDESIKLNEKVIEIIGKPVDLIVDDGEEEEKD